VEKTVSPVEGGAPHVDDLYGQTESGGKAKPRNKEADTLSIEWKAPRQMEPLFAEGIIQHAAARKCCDEIYAGTPAVRIRATETG
jgi:hypothetical protein